MDRVICIEKFPADESVSPGIGYAVKDSPSAGSRTPGVKASEYRTVMVVTDGTTGQQLSIT